MIIAIGTNTECLPRYRRFRYPKHQSYHPIRILSSERMKIKGSMATSPNHGFSCLVAVILRILAFDAVFRIVEVQAALVTYPPVTYPYDNLPLHVQSPLIDQRQRQPHQHQLDESQHHESPETATPSTNVIFFLADDQDLHLESLLYQALVKKHLVDEGLTFRHHFCTVALCCPSRVNLWTGLAAHNTNVTDVNPPYGMMPSKRTWSTSTLF